MSVPITSGPFNPAAPVNAVALTGEQHLYYWHIRALISTHGKHEVLAVSPDAIKGYSQNSWKHLRAAVERLVFDEGLIKSYATAGDNATLLLQIHDDDIFNPQLPPTSPWYSPGNPCKRVSEPLPAPTIQSVAFSPAQLQYLCYVHSCMAAKAAGDKGVLVLDPYAQSTRSPSPVSDMRKALEHMLHEERSLVAIASCEQNKFLIMVTNEDWIASPLDASRTSDWISRENPADRAAETLISLSGKEKAQQLDRLLDSYDRALLMHQGEENTPQLKEAGQEMLALLTRLTVLPQILDQNRCVALAHALVHADASWYKESLPLMQSLVLKAIVEATLTIKPPSQLPSKLFQKMVEQLLALPAQHRNVLAFSKGFSSVESLPPSLAATHNYHQRWSVVLRSDRNNQMGQNCFAFVRTAEFVHFFNHLCDAERRSFLHDIFAYVGRFSLSPSRNESDKWMELLEMAVRFDPAYCRIILEGLSYTVEVGNLVRICLHPGADAPLVTHILAHQPPDRSELAEDKESFKSLPDPFFFEFICRLPKPSSPQKDRVLKWIMEAIFQGRDESRKELLLKYLTDQIPLLGSERNLPFLARNFVQLPASFQLKVYSETLLMLTNELIRNPAPDTEKNLKAILQALTADSTCLSLECIRYEAALLLLLALGDEPQQVKIISSILHQGGALLSKLPAVSPAVWDRIGEQCPHGIDYRKSEVLPTLSPQAKVGLLNGLVARPSIKSDTNLNTLLVTLFQQLLKKDGFDPECLSQWSIESLDLFLWFAAKKSMGELEAGEYINYLLAHDTLLQNVSPDAVARITQFVRTKLL